VPRPKRVKSFADVRFGLRIVTWVLSNKPTTMSAYPPKRTLTEPVGMSALCQKPTSADENSLS
jgi:hypothetical protein